MWDGLPVGQLIIKMERLTARQNAMRISLKA